MCTMLTWCLSFAYFRFKRKVELHLNSEVKYILGGSMGEFEWTCISLLTYLCSFRILVPGLSVPVQ